MKFDFINEKGEITAKEVSWSDFSRETKPSLLAQAVRVFLGNQRRGNAVAKTRGQVDGTTKKIYKQKGTGSARHGSRKAPIFVGGGKAHGPTGGQNYSGSINKKMVNRAWMAALAAKKKENKLFITDDFNWNKTKQAGEFWKIVSQKEKVNNGLLIVDLKANLKLIQATSNLDSLTVTNTGNLNAYQILKARSVFITKSALTILQGKESKNEVTD